jgi:hypothetical protein
MDGHELIVENLEDWDEDVTSETALSVDPDEFFAKSAFRIIYQTNNFFLPQIRDLIESNYSPLCD